MSWYNVKLIYFRELRDQLRDRRTLFTIAVLPLLLYPLLAMIVFQVQQFRREYPSRIQVVGAEKLPSEPQLFGGGNFLADYCPEQESRLLQLEFSPALGAGVDDEQIASSAQQDVQAGRFDAVVYFPHDFSSRLREFRAAQGVGAKRDPVPSSKLQPEIFLNSASDKSREARIRLGVVLERWRETLVQDNLKKNNLPAATITPFEVNNRDVAEPLRKQAALWSKILPFVLLVWALTGAFYPAVDLCAGEKERGTLETLLSSPALRSEIVWGKLLTVMTFSMATALLNLASMVVTTTFIMTQIERSTQAHLPFEIGPPPLAALCWLVLSLAPISALFSALSLAIAAFARSSKEGQYYLLPLLMFSLPLMSLPLMPSAQLDLGTALIPLTGMMLLLRALIEGQYLEALKYLPFVAAVTAACCRFAIRWAIDQFNNESVLFRESERFGLGLWLRHLLRDREDMPNAAHALFCGVLLVGIRFITSLMMQMPGNWQELVQSTLVAQVALIAFPAALMAIMLTRRPLQALALRAPSFWITIPAAALLALLLHPAVRWLGLLIQTIYPVAPEIAQAYVGLETMIQAMPLGTTLLVFALLPAVCEELAFRGFVLSGLRRTGHKWGAILLTSAFFGITHGMLQQSLNAFLVGIVIGYVAVKTNSIWPAMVFHCVHNGLAMLAAHHSLAATEEPTSWRTVVDSCETLLTVPISELYRQAPFLQTFLDGLVSPDQRVFHPLAVLAATAGAAAILYGFKQLPYHASAEERLQTALDNQCTAPAAA